MGERLGRVVLVHDNLELVASVAASLMAIGHEVQAFENPLRAISSLTAEHRVDVLVTRLSFAEGLSNGVSLAMMARNRRAALEVLFIAPEEHRAHADGIGDFLPMPASVGRIVSEVERLLLRPPV
jgi:DNA-binding NtrC family response regulator